MHWLKCSNNILYNKQWQEMGIKFMEHIYDYRSKHFITLKKCNFYDIPDKDFLKYYHIVNNIHEYWKALLKEGNRTHTGTK